MKQSIKEEIWFLFFEKLYYVDDIIEHFKNKYTYNEIKSVINEKY